MSLSAVIDLKSLSDHVFDRIVEAIVSGDLPPGSRISEVGLARSLGIGRAPLREAIGRLEGRKLVTRTPRLGTRVVALAPGDIVDIFRVQKAGDLDFHYLIARGSRNARLIANARRTFEDRPASREPLPGTIG